jgi:hypothetical protein
MVLGFPVMMIQGRLAMPKLIVDDALGSKLDTCATPVELCDKTGRLLGHFFPVPHTKAISLPADGCPHTEDELVAMRNESGGRPLVEIWKSLGRE